MTPSNDAEMQDALNAEKQRLLQSANMLHGADIQRIWYWRNKVRQRLSDVLGAGAETVLGNAKTVDAPTQARIHDAIVQHNSRIGSLLDLPDAKNLGAHVLGGRAALNTLVTDPESEDARMLVYWYDTLKLSGQHDQLFQSLNNAPELANAQRLRAIRALFQKINDTKEYRDIGKEGSIAGTPPLVTGASGKIQKVQEKIAQKRNQIATLQAAIANPTTNAQALPSLSEQVSKLQTEEGQLEGQVDALNDKKGSLKDELRQLGTQIAGVVGGGSKGFADSELDSMLSDFNATTIAATFPKTGLGKAPKVTLGGTARDVLEWIKDDQPGQELETLYLRSRRGLGLPTSKQILRSMLEMHTDASLSHLSDDAKRKVRAGLEDMLGSAEKEGGSAPATSSVSAAPSGQESGSGDKREWFRLAAGWSGQGSLKNPLKWPGSIARFFLHKDGWMRRQHNVSFFGSSTSSSN